MVKRPPAGGPPSRGHSLVGDIKNYVPVTDAMLKNPPPGDWLMARRNYQAWSYSPLDEITRGNVKELKLAWSWSMNDAGSNQAMPLIHNGIMYLGNTGNMMQALDAATGSSLGNQSAQNIAASGAVATSRSIATRSHGEQRRPPRRFDARPARSLGYPVGVAAHGVTNRASIVARGK